MVKKDKRKDLQADSFDAQELDAMMKVTSPLMWFSLLLIVICLAVFF